MPPKKNAKRKNQKKPYKPRRKRVRRQAINASETKLQKDTLNFETMPAGATNIHEGNFWLTPYSESACWNRINPDTSTPVDNRKNTLNMATNLSSDARIILPAVGQFIANGTTRDTRVGRRITMMSSTVEMVFHIRAIGAVGPPVTYTYSANPEFRIIKGWVKDGVKGLQDLTHDISSLYGEIPYAKYKIQYDKVLSRRLQSSGLTAPELEGTYAPFKFKFSWRPKKTITFDAQSSSVTQGANVQYTGWTPFIYFFNPHSNLEISWDYLKRVNAFKDL